MVNIGCIDINPWMSRKDSPEQPDYINIDLDPSDDDFGKAVEAAKAAKQILDAYKLIGFAKTSGKTGMHIYIPCAGFTYPQARVLSGRLCDQIHQLLPGITTREIEKSRRGNALLIDDSQNDYADTLAAPYSVRPGHAPIVSTPLEWREVKKGLNPGAFTIDTICKRIFKKGDLFTSVLDKSIASKNTKALEKLLA
jgi:bifunctional non-homologous end joining protein LigD